MWLYSHSRSSPQSPKIQLLSTEYSYVWLPKKIAEALTFGTESKVRMMCSHKGKCFILYRNNYCVTTPQLKTFHTYPGTRAKWQYWTEKLLSLQFLKASKKGGHLSGQFCTYSRRVQQKDDDCLASPTLHLPSQTGQNTNSGGEEYLCNFSTVF